jgi:hypothetical protein
MALLICTFDGPKDDLTLKLGQLIPDDKLNKFMSPRTNVVVYVDTYELGDASMGVCCDILGRQRPSGLIHAFFGDNAKEIVGNWNTYQKEVHGVTP